MTVRNLLPLAADETARLIRASAGRTVSLAFGTGGAALKADECRWAVDLLREWRGETFIAGGGI